MDLVFGSTPTTSSALTPNRKPDDTLSLFLRSKGPQVIYSAKRPTTETVVSTPVHRSKQPSERARVSSSSDMDDDSSSEAAPRHVPTFSINARKTTQRQSQSSTTTSWTKQRPRRYFNVSQDDTEGPSGGEMTETNPSRLPPPTLEGFPPSYEPSRTAASSGSVEERAHPNEDDDDDDHDDPAAAADDDTAEDEERDSQQEGQNLEAEDNDDDDNDDDPTAIDVGDAKLEGLVKTKEEDEVLGYDVSSEDLVGSAGGRTTAATTTTTPLEHTMAHRSIRVNTRARAASHVSRSGRRSSPPSPLQADLGVEGRYTAVDDVQHRHVHETSQRRRYRHSSHDGRDETGQRWKRRRGLSPQTAQVQPRPQPLYGLVPPPPPNNDPQLFVSHRCRRSLLLGDVIRLLLRELEETPCDCGHQFPNELGIRRHHHAR